MCVRIRFILRHSWILNLKIYAWTNLKRLQNGLKSVVLKWRLRIQPYHWFPMNMKIDFAPLYQINCQLLKNNPGHWDSVHKIWIIFVWLILYASVIITLTWKCKLFLIAAWSILCKRDEKGWCKAFTVKADQVWKIVLNGIEFILIPFVVLN